MTPVDLAGIAEPHRSAVTAIIDLVRQGVFTDAQALLMIVRIRAAAGEPAGPATRTPEETR
ncbi:hypothetical protein AB0M80_37745 [Amycolatopsis sp. NPDC051045]|uniref:hypothetical protein n=1 Tax=Amycolatopsis sp. NPDC051045 TaxID=3156922 RepID=UPI0034196968